MNASPVAYRIALSQNDDRSLPEGVALGLIAMTVADQSTPMFPSNHAFPEPGASSLGRRGFLKSTAIGGLVSALPPSMGYAAPAAPVESGRPKDYLGREYAVVYRVPSAERFVHDPGLVRLPGGRRLAIVPPWLRKSQHMANDPSDAHWLKILASDDRGETWQLLGELPYMEGTPFVNEGRSNALCSRSRMARWRSSPAGMTVVDRPIPCLIMERVD